MWSAERPSTTGCEIRPLSTLLSPEAQRLAQNTEPRTRTNRRVPGRAIDERHPDPRTMRTPPLQAVSQRQAEVWPGERCLIAQRRTAMGAATLYDKDLVVGRPRVHELVDPRERWDDERGFVVDGNDHRERRRHQTRTCSRHSSRPSASDRS